MGPRKRRATIRKRRIPAKFVVGLGLLLCLGLGARRAASWLLVRPVRVEEGTVEQTVSGEGVVIRDEEAFTVPPGAELKALVREGDRVRVGTPIMEAEDDSASKELKRVLSEAEAELAEWTAQNQPKVTSLSEQLSACRSKLDDLLSQVLASLSAGDAARAKALEAAISSELATHRDLTGEYDGILARGNRLIEQKASVERALSSAVARVCATIPGVVSFKVDGLESCLSGSPLSLLSPRALKVIVQNKPSSIPGGSYKIVRSQDVTVGVVCSVEKAAQVISKGILDLKIGEKSYKARVKQLSQQDPPGFVNVFFDVPDAAQDLIDARQVQVDIVLGRLSGVLVPKNCLTRRGEVTGVFVVKKTIARFQPVEVLGEVPGKGILVSDLLPGQYVATHPWLVKEGQVIR